MYIQTTGLLKSIKEKTWSRGQFEVKWSEIDRFMKTLKIENTEKASEEWAAKNMMYIVVNRNTHIKSQIDSITFCAAK